MPRRIFGCLWNLAWVIAAAAKVLTCSIRSARSNSGLNTVWHRTRSSRRTAPAERWIVRARCALILKSPNTRAREASMKPRISCAARRKEQLSEGEDMPNRRDLLKNAAATTAGVAISGRFPSFQIGAPPGKRREVFIGGRRVKTVDAHAHCFVPEVWDLVKDTPLAATAKGNLTGNIALGNPQRLIDMDAQGIDYQAINVNAWGYSAERALARDLIKLQNERISQWCAKHPDRFVGMATVALQ